MITLLLLIAFIVGVIAIGYAWKLYWDLPKAIITAFIIGSLISYIIIGNKYINNYIFDINHPVYSAPNSGISTLSILISIAGGIVLAGPVAIIKIIKYPK